MHNEFRSRNAYWPEDEVKKLLQKAPIELTLDELRLVCSDLDRRFIQLWDKVEFEKKHGLVDYGKLKGK